MRDVTGQYTEADWKAEDKFAAQHDASTHDADRCACGGLFCPADGAHYPPVTDPRLARDPCSQEG